jgi:hypothetical protein
MNLTTIICNLTNIIPGNQTQLISTILYNEVSALIESLVVVNMFITNQKH